MNRLNKLTLMTALLMFFFLRPVFAFEEVITVPAEKAQGVTLNLPKGDYLVKFEGGAISLVYPINPNYQWLVGVAVGTAVKGNQDEPNLGTIYFDPKPKATSQADAEAQAIKATKESVGGTFLRFSLKENKTVRFWVSDFDYTDNNGLVKLKVSSL